MTDAYSELGEVLGLLNSQAGDRYLFSGRAADQPAVDSLDHIMNGDGARAGLKQVIAERNQADLGSNGLGRLAVSAPTVTSVAVAEDAAGSPFGLKLAGVNSTLGNATVSGPTGVPPAVSVALTGLPSDGQSLQLRFTLPDGTSESISLTATSSANASGTEPVHHRSAAPAATVANLQAALTTSLSKLANTSLVAASAVKASDDFFGNPPQRVAGPPFATATVAVAGTQADTVSWYTGEDGTDAARGTATATIDPSITVSYGMRANEQGLRSIVQNLATLAVVTFAQSGSERCRRRATALSQRVGTNLDAPAGSQTIADIQADLAGAQTTLAAAADRHAQTTATLSDMLDQIEGVPQEQVAAQILALQTQMQASLQTTALLLKTSLVNYL